MIATYFSFVAFPWAIGMFSVYDKIEESCRYLRNLVKIKKNICPDFRRGCFLRFFGAKNHPFFNFLFVCNLQKSNQYIISLHLSYSVT